MKTICLYFEIHQIIHLKRYRFFEIGSDHYYYDDFANEQGINEIAERSYIPALNTLIQMAKENEGAFKVALSISGVALEQLEIYAPAVIELLHELNNTGCCEFLCEPYSHGLSSLANEDCFKEEVGRMRKKIKDYFGQEPKVFRNSSLIYNNEIGGMVANMGFKGMLIEGAKHVLGWKSPHYLYHCVENPNLKLLMRDFKLSDDISLRFSNSDWSEYPLFADKYIGWIDSMPESEQVINIFMELSALGYFQPLSSNILDFIKALPVCAKQKGITFSTPTEIVTKLKSVDGMDVPYPMSWVDEERDISPWLGNVMQREAFNKLYSVAERVYLCDDKRIKQDWDYLQRVAMLAGVTDIKKVTCIYRWWVNTESSQTVHSKAEWNYNYELIQKKMCSLPMIFPEAGTRQLLEMFNPPSTVQEYIAEVGEDDFISNLHSRDVRKFIESYISNKVKKMMGKKPSQNIHFKELKRLVRMYIMKKLGKKHK